ncbi:MAG: hypothetical protein H7Y02_03655 [Candidatus Obscuribacterales bacterium]|nr:hypothetical protein [Steroidobacteraceae bacterium]
MSLEAPKPIAMPSIDYADHTVEIDTRWLFADRPELDAKMKAAEESRDHGDTRVGVDLTATQINELLAQGK